MKYDFDGLEDRKIELLTEKCEDYIKQLTIHRNKRGINFLGTTIKFITGIPDHDDMVLVQNKLNDLIENNNKMAIINTKLQKKLKHLTHSNEYNIEMLYEWMVLELEEIINTINLAKTGILNTIALNLDEINQIIKKEIKDAPLMEILEHSEFKILQIKSVYVLLVKYPKIKEKCKLFNIRPVELEGGKLDLENFVAQCNTNFITVKNCKKYISTNICSYFEHTCTQELLNGRKANCTMIKEHMKSIEEIDNGKLLIHGTHTINNITKVGTYLIFFNNSILIDEQNFTNDKDLISEYLKSNKLSQFEILQIIESQNKELMIPNLNIIQKIPLEFENHPVRSIFIFIVHIIIILIIIQFILKAFKAYNIYKLRKQQERDNAYVRALFNLES